MPIRRRSAISRRSVLKRIAATAMLQGYVTVPDTPGIGVELNDEIMKKHLRRPGYFEPTSNYEEFQRMTGGWPHFDDQGKWCDNCVSYR